MSILRYDRSRRTTWRGDKVMAAVRRMNRQRERAKRIGDPASPRALLLLMVLVFAGGMLWMG